MSESISIIIADDHPLIRRGLREVIEENEKFKILAEAGDGESALHLIERHRPDICVLDIDMPKRTGLEVARIIQQKRMPVRVIVLTMHTEVEAFDQAIEAGAMGYILKDNVLTEIISCLNFVSAGRPFLSSAVSGFALRGKTQQTKTLDIQLGTSKLSDTERKVLYLIAQHKSTKEIAEELFVSPRTIDTHRANIASKLELRGSNALLHFALEHKHLLT